MKKVFKAKHYFFVALICIISFNVCAQKEESTKKVPRKEKFTFGPKVSVNITNEWVSKKIKTEFTPGADLGLFFRFTPCRLYIQPEIFYAIRNQSIESWWNSITTSTKYQSHHIGIPILVGFKAIDLKQLKIRIFVGPEFCLKLKDNLTNLNYQMGFQAGLGFDIWRFTIDGSYSFLGNLRSNKGTHSNVFKVGVGFKCY